MPVVRTPEDLPPETHDGWSETLCASEDTFDAPVPLRARRVAVQPGAVAHLTTQGREVMLYVVSGAGELETEDERHRLAPESMAWLDGAGALSLAADPPARGGSGLEIIVTEAPGS